MTLRVRDTTAHQEKLLDLVYHARDYFGLSSDFVTVFTNACEEGLTDPDLAAWNEEIRRRVKLPVYTTTLAAAWCGVGIDAIRDGLWKIGDLRSWKPGHDKLILHQDLVKWYDSRN